jgi:hypothetical protein
MHHDFARKLGFESEEDLRAASTVVVDTGTYKWYITALPGGRWAAWDNAEPVEDHGIFNSREEAVSFLRNGFVLKGWPEKYWCL